MKKIRLKELFNIPNCLCYLRIILIPIFLHRYFLAGSKEDYYICATILIISGLSDFLDGYIARHYQMITDFGKVIDPIADKLTQFTVAFVLVLYVFMDVVITSYHCFKRWNAGFRGTLFI